MNLPDWFPSFPLALLIIGLPVVLAEVGVDFASPSSQLFIIELAVYGGYGVPEDPWSFEYEIAVPKARISTPAVPFPSLRPRAKAAVSIRTLMIVS